MPPGFLDIFLAECEQRIARQPSGGRKKRFGRQALRLIRLVRERALHRQPGLDRGAVCRKLGLSPMQLHQMFRRSFGTTYSQFMNRCRVEEAKNLLASRTDTGSLEELARRAGFRSISSFNDRFKMFTRMTPTEFRDFCRHFRETTGMELQEYRADGRRERPKPQRHPAHGGNDDGEEG